MILEKSIEISGHSGAVYDIAAKEDFLYSCSADKFVTRWSISTGEQDSFAIKASSAVYSIALIMHDNELWIGLANGDVHVIGLQNKQEIKYFQQHKSAIFSLLHLSKQNLMVCSDSEGNLSVWNAQSKSLVLLLPINCGKIRHLQTNEDESLLFLHCQDEQIRVLETAGFNEIITLDAHQNGANCSIHIQDSSQLISGGKDGLIKIWDLAKESLIHSYPAHNFAVYDLIDFPNHGMYLSCSRDKSIKLWGRTKHEFIQKIEAKTGGHKHSVNRLIKLNSNQFAACSDDKTISIWNIR